MSNRGNSYKIRSSTHCGANMCLRLNLPQNGIKLQGQVESFDQYVVLLKNTVIPNGL